MHKYSTSYTTVAKDIDFGPNIGLCSIMIYNNEIDPAHFHIVNNNGFDCAIKISTPEYYFHDASKDVLTDDQINILISVLDDIGDHMFGTNTTNWEFTIGYWQAAENDISEYKSIMKRPDYTKLNNVKINS